MTAGQASAEDLAAILDTTAESIMMFDAEGNIHACNRSAEALFGYDGAELVRRNLADLFAPESRAPSSNISKASRARASRCCSTMAATCSAGQPGRHHGVVDDHGTPPAGRSEFLRGVSQ